MFTASATSASILKGSHLHIEDYLQKSAVVPDSDNLLWKLNNDEIPCHLVYVGYYGPSSYIITKTGEHFGQSLSLSVTSPSIHSLLFNDLKIELGTEFNRVDIGTLNSSALGSSFLQFAHSNTLYPTIDSLGVYVSNDKCTLSAEYDEYNIFKLGQTIPIVINFTLCRPITDMEMVLSVDTPYIQKNEQLTTQTITSSTELAYIILTHPQNITSTLNNDYTLSISFTSSDATVQSAYNPIPAVTIHVISPDSVVGNPEGKQP